ncbi:MAG: Tn3 family transposase [Moraxellaceae bacterium]|nr:Tn3 family transposase [Moraxellaceae bacterium]
MQPSRHDTRENTFGKDKGVVAYSFLANHVALQTELIGANQHESYWVFDICYNNTSDIVPTMITGDMHSINKANFCYFVLV